jgi:ATP-dependent helicase HrpB
MKSLSPRGERPQAAAPLGSLPIDAHLERIRAAFEERGAVVLVAPPGAGKSTRVPRALYQAGFADRGEILVLEPRRLAARTVAVRVSEELGEGIGGTVGYTTRFDDASSARTRIRFVTEGIVTRRLLSDPELRGVSLVILDEFHERHLHGDVALASVRKLRGARRPDLGIAVMSATLDADPVARFLDAPVIRCEGRAFDVAVEHLPERTDAPLEALVSSALKRLIREGLDGDVLVFLPGAREIRRAAEACAAIAEREGLALMPLHGSLSPAEQDRALAPADRRKVVLATNVAETSVTIEGIAAVIDSGLARVASHAPWSGLPTLRLSPISRASAAQRAGRAGRTRAGRCLRLYTRGDHDARPEHDTPEILRADVAETALELLASGEVDLDSFPWFERPRPQALEAARALLAKLGAVDARGAVTAIGRRMLDFPLHPRLARLLVEAEQRGVGREGAIVAAILGERDATPQESTRVGRHRSDVIELLDAYEGAAGRPGQRGPATSSARAVERQLVRRVKLGAAPPSSAAEHERALLLAVLAGYPDRVGRLRRPDASTGRAAREILFASGGTGVLAPSSGVADVDLVVAVSVEERVQGRSGKTTVRLASAIEEDFLIELFADSMKDETIAVWNPSLERVDVFRRLSYEGLLLEETRAAHGDPREIARVLAEAVRARGFRSFTDGDALDQWLARLAFAREHAPELDLPHLDEGAIDRELLDLCVGASSFAELRAADLGASIRARLSPAQARALVEIAPDALVLPGGRRLRIEYAPGAPPKAASRLQDFFGMRRGPSVARGKVAVQIHLLAPNQRAVQITTDLEGFWARHYAGVARELRRRYPKHAWPDDPLTASPPSRPARKT